MKDIFLTRCRSLCEWCVESPEPSMLVNLPYCTLGAPCVEAALGACYIQYSAPTFSEEIATTRLRERYGNCKKLGALH